MKKIKQILAGVMIAILLVVSVISFSSCTPKVELAKPENTNLEYWLLDTINENACIELYIDGGVSKWYLDTKYDAIITEEGKLTAPKEAIVYVLEKYPYTDFGVSRRISSIRITDPNISVWGLTINSTREEFVDVMTNVGFELTYEGERAISFKYDKITVSLDYGTHLIISYAISDIGTKIFM